MASSGPVMKPSGGIVTCQMTLLTLSPPNANYFHCIVIPNVQTL